MMTPKGFKWLALPDVHAGQWMDIQGRDYLVYVVLGEYALIKLGGT